MQSTLFREKQKLDHGGEKSCGKRKTQRPFAKNKWIHLVLRSDLARGTLSLRAKRNRHFVQTLIEAKGRAFGVQVADFANVGNHLHIKLRTATRLQLQKFLRSITGRIARHVTGARRGRPFGRFWKYLAYTRVLKSRLEEWRLTSYFEANRIEAAEGTEARAEYLASCRERRFEAALGPPAPG